jgi:diguanylate cyclase (GGDEF)-like protein
MFYLGNALIVFSMIGLFMIFYLNHVLSSERNLKTIADNDELTQLYNRRKMRDFLGIAYTDAIENRIPFSIAIFDIDDFKNVNDTYGHDAGDQVLKYVSDILRFHNSDSVAVGRWGGEEFLLLEKIKDTMVSNVLRIEKIRKQVAEHKFFYNSHYFSITITGGISRFTPGDSISSVIRHADEKLYEGKLRGKNCVVATATM